MARSFDTLAAARRLQEAGMQPGQAEAIVEAIREGQGDLVTKADLLETVAGLERRIFVYGLALAGLVVGAVGLLVRLLV
ncbi:MAG: hypothetical protein OXU75_05095 [Deltaproteobacteria bacterium]|nr:hypothetical protein [Deltaproteobacteria bacterium]